ncbi:hypothetical protein MHYP_G00283480 [Metynnis hypsauchen]
MALYRSFHFLSRRIRGAASSIRDVTMVIKDRTKSAMDEEGDLEEDFSSLFYPVSVESHPTVHAQQSVALTFGPTGDT